MSYRSVYSNETEDCKVVPGLLASGRHAMFHRPNKPTRHEVVLTSTLIRQLQATPLAIDSHQRLHNDEKGRSSKKYCGLVDSAQLTHSRNLFQRTQLTFFKDRCTLFIHAYDNLEVVKWYMSPSNSLIS